jgi:hypothetical protein
METVPGNMLALFRPPFKKRPAGKRRKSYKNSFSTHDPEHIESSQGIKRIKSFYNWFVFVFHKIFFDR